MALRKETTGTRENMGPSPPGPGVSGGKRKSLPGPCVLCLWHHYGMGYKATGLLPGRGPWASSGQPILPEQQPQPLSCLPGTRRRWTSPPPTHQGQQPHCTEALGRELGPCDGESPWKHASGHVYKSLSPRARNVHPECSGGTNPRAVPSTAGVNS